MRHAAPVLRPRGVDLPGHLRFTENVPQAELHAQSAVGLDLGEAVYLGRPGEMKRTQHVLVTGILDGNTSLKWALRREGKR